MIPISQILLISGFILITFFFAGLNFIYPGILNWHASENKKQKNLLSVVFFQFMEDDSFLYRFITKFGYIYFFLISIFLLLNFSVIYIGTGRTSLYILLEVLGSFLLFLIFFGVLSRIIFLFISKTRGIVIYIPALIFYLICFPLGRLFFLIRNLFEIYVLRVNDLKFKFDLLSGGTYEKLSAGNENGKYDQEFTMMQNALLFSKIKVRDCMIPRTEVEAVDINSSIKEVRDKSISSGYSRIIVYRENMDNIEGYINVKELFKNPATVVEKISPVSFVPETMPANKLLQNFMQQHRSLAVVVDEYGGTAGIVTLEDIMEQIFGDIEDEHDTDDLIEKKISPNEFMFSSRLEIEYINSKYGLQIPENENYDTLSGYILFHHQNLPKVNEIIIMDQFSFKILKVTNTRIELVLLRILTN